MDNLDRRAQVFICFTCLHHYPPSFNVTWYVSIDILSCESLFMYDIIGCPCTSHQEALPTLIPQPPHLGISCSVLSALLSRWLNSWQASIWLKMNDTMTRQGQRGLPRLRESTAPIQVSKPALEILCRINTTCIRSLMMLINANNMKKTRFFSPKFHWELVAISCRNNKWYS